MKKSLFFRIVATVLLAVSVTSPMAGVARAEGIPKLTKAYLPVLMFHYIRDMSPASKDKVGYRLSVSPAKLEEFLGFLKDHGIESVNFQDLQDSIDGKKALPAKPVMLTFDDGYEDHYTAAFPLLKKYGMKGVFFIISGKPNVDPAYATWAQIKEMADQGQEIGSHSVTHRDLAILSKKTLINEVEQSKKTIEEKIGKPVISFCYPSGEYDGRTLALVKQHYSFARTTHAGKTFSVEKRYTMPTVRISPTTTLDSFKKWFHEK